ncbi:VanZ family protein [Aurantimonas aggregata]|uniref:VanZ family protein n=1 Tax=Aurantimonas aggregata TaxID=2047720 RepID=UPI001942B99C|nr:VanZ family protein [Aurantimonas aggregata]
MLFFSAAALVAWFGFFDNYQLPVPPRVADGDKVGHVAGFGLLALTAGLLFGTGRRAAVLLSVAAAALEGVQLFLPTRQASVTDLLASLAGIGLGFAGAFALSALAGWVGNGMARGGDGGSRRGEELP